MKIYTQTLGCKVNQYETQALETMLQARGHAICASPAESDVCIVNTCAVTAESGRKSRQAIRRIQRENPRAFVAVCGCFSQVSPEEVAALHVDMVYGSGDRCKFVDDLERLYREKQGDVCVDEALKRRAFEELPAGNLSGRTRAMLKIQDGCSNFCTYCIIPYARGPVRSMDPEHAAEKAAQLEEAGYREIVVTGIEIASYGRDLKTGVTLTDVVCAIAGSAPNTRIRLGSLEPRIVTEDFCARLKALSNFCPHFHLSLQSGCDKTLAGMKRKYDTARFLQSVRLLKQHFPGCGLTADLIVGFPGETDEDFQKTLEFIQVCGFSAMHIFPYSPRPGTVAAGMDGQVPKQVKHARAAAAGKVAARMEEAFLESCVGSVQRVLLEKEADGVFTGHCENYCPVAVSGSNLRNTVLNVQITGVKDGILCGNAVL